MTGPSLPGTGPTQDDVIAILGAGSLGRLWGGYLSGRNVAFVPRPGHYLSGQSLRYRFQDDTANERTVTVPWLSDLSRASLLLVTTKAPDTLEALAGIAGQLPDQCPVVLFQNGMGSQQAAAERWPHRPVLAASTTEGANRPDPDGVIHAGRGQTWVGALTPSGGEAIAWVVEQLARSGLSVQPEHRIVERLWAKLVINAGINPFTALLDCPNGDILAAPLFLEHIDPLCQEMADLMAAEALTPATPAELRRQIEAVARNTSRNTSSMCSDMRNGRATEIDYINGYIAERARALGLSAPVNQMLTARVKERILHPGH